MSDEYQPNEVVESQPEPEAPSSAATTASTSSVAAETPALDDAVEAPSAEPELAESVSEAAGESSLTSDEPADTGVEAAGVEADTPAVVSIADLDAPDAATPSPLDGVFAQARTLLQGRGWVVGVVLAVLLVLFLFLPPISLAQRIGGGRGYEALDAQRTTLEHPDGLVLERSSAAEGRLQVKLGSIPRADFVAGTVAEAQAALAGLPQHLEPKSPMYTLAVRGNGDQAALLRVSIPNEAEPWETLDLYAWHEANGWRWVPSHLDRDGETLIAEVAALPPSLMVMQSGMAEHRIVAEGTTLPDAAAEAVLDEISVAGMLIGTLGGLTGDAAQLPAAQANPVVVVPVVRNWVHGRPPNPALVSDMLNLSSDRQAHVQNLLALAQGGGYPGLVVDYRQVYSQDREVFTSFVEQLATAFHNAGLWLAVTVETPQYTGSAWDTGGYDWRALGAAADQVRVVMPLAPDAYAPGGLAEQLLEWATGVVERYRLIPVYSTLSTDGVDTVTLDEVLAPLGQVTSAQPITDSVEPGEVLSFTLGQGLTAEVDGTIGATHVTVGNDVYWLGTPGWLTSRMELAARYHLGGLVLRDLLAPGNLDGLVPAIADYQAGLQRTASALPEVTWQVTEPGGRITQHTASLSQPQFVWTAPQITGTYTIAATVAALDKGSIAVTVAEPTDVPTDTLALNGEQEDEAEEPAALTAEAVGLRAAYVADVTIPDNTRLEKGEEFVKTWRLRNAGTEDWPADTVFVFVSGERLGPSQQVEVGAVAAGENVDISVDMVAPDRDGTFRSDWALSTGGQSIAGGRVYVQIRVGEEQAAAPAPAPVAPAPRPSGGFELGGHVRDMNLPYKDLMRYAGMNWIKTQVSYRGDAAWMINIARANGFKIQLSAIGGPRMVTEPGFVERYASWVADMARAGADAIEIWNEPNIDREWQIGHISPQAYTNLLCASYNAIKAANPNTAVISAAPAPTGYFGGCSPNGCDDKPWLEGMWNAGAVNCMDYIGAHHNAGATSPSARSGHPADPGSTHHSWFFLPQTELYYNIFRGTRKLFYTEMGFASQEGVPPFSDMFAWARGTNNAQQAAWLAEAVRLSINTGMVRSIVVWNIDFVRFGYDPQDGFAIIRPDGSCPACHTLHQVLGTR